jgi:hypothetical protein
MVLISHEHEFILLKSSKTAGSSVEAAFYGAITNVDPSSDNAPEVHNDLMYCSPRGSRAGARPPNHRPGARPPNQRLLNSHSGISTIYHKFPEAKKYRIIICVRDPYDRYVSTFWWILAKYPKVHAAVGRMPFAFQKLLFNFWVLNGEPITLTPTRATWGEVLRYLSGTPRSRATFAHRRLTKQGAPFKISNLLDWEGNCLPVTPIYFERLEESTELAMESIGLTGRGAPFPAFKTSQRLEKVAPAFDYYWRSSSRRVESELNFEFETFGYPKLSGS